MCHQAEDLGHPFHVVHCRGDLSLGDERLVEHVAHAAQFTDDQLEPQFERLVHDDEVQLVVAEFVTALQIEKLVQVQVVGIRLGARITIIAHGRPKVWSFYRITSVSLLVRGPNEIRFRHPHVVNTGPVRNGKR